MTRAITLLALAIWLCLLAEAGRAQEPSPGSEAECRAGELCQRSDTAGEPAQTGRQPVPDPPGAYPRSLVTIGLIAALVGTYLVVALTGRNPIRRRNLSRGRSSP